MNKTGLISSVLIYVALILFDDLRTTPKCIINFTHIYSMREKLIIHFVVVRKSKNINGKCNSY